MRSLLFIAIVILGITGTYAQGEANNWFFGFGAGLTFDSVTGTVTPTNAALSTISTNEGCSSISDVNGNLLFYSDGRNVWDANHQIMPNADYNNGTGLLGDPSSTSSALIVPRPGNLDQFYVFTVDEPHHMNGWAYPDQGPANESGTSVGTYDDGATIPSGDDGYNNGLNYTLIDLSLNGGNGDADSAEKNVQLITYNTADIEESKFKCSEKITAVEHADGQSYWLITQFIDTFYAFRIDASGVNTTPVESLVSPIITTDGYRRNGIGYLKSSPDGGKLVVAHNENGTQQGQTAGGTGSAWMYDFDNSTGTVSNALLLEAGVSFYGVAFSQDSKKVYLSGNNSVRQFDLDATDISASKTIVFSGFSFIGAMQLAPNGKIYICNTSNSQALDVINMPAAVGAACGYQEDGQALASGTASALGLPPFIQSFLVANIQYENDCLGETTAFSVSTSETVVDILWDFGDGQTSTLVNPSNTYNAAGNYTVQLVITTPNETQTFTTDVTIFESPTANTPSNIDVCDDNNDGVFDFDFDPDVTNEVLGSQLAADFNVLYFTSQADADAGSNPISLPFSNTSNAQQIFVRIENVLNTTCYDTTSFIVEVFDTPTANVVDTLSFCDDGIDGSLTNGQMDVDLSAATTVVLGSQSPADFNVTYHLNQNDADTNTNALPLTFYNSTPFAQTIFVRIENVLNTDCFDTSSFVVEVNPIPDSFNSSLFQCDEDGFVDGFTIFNCHEADDVLTGNITGLSTAFYLTMADAQSSSNPINGNNFPNTSNPQTLYVQVIDDASGCFSISQLELEVSTTDVSDALLVRCDDDGTEDGLASFDLTQADSMVLVGAPTGVTITYYASNQDALLEQNPLISPFVNTSPYSQNIYARAEDDNACYGISQVLLQVNPLPILQDDQTIIYCLNTFPAAINLNAGVIGGGSGLSYSWNTGEATEDIQVNQAGVYRVTVENANGCSQQRQITVVASDTATIENIVVTDASEQNAIAVFVSGVGNYEFALDNPLGNYQNIGFFDQVSPGIHTVYVRDINGCGITQEMVSVIGFMKFFTPNGDGFNDTWQVIGLSSQFQPDSKIIIYDRYGKLITLITPEHSGWDGTYNGYKMPASDYWFQAILQDGRSFKGHFTLKR